MHQKTTRQSMPVQKQNKAILSTPKTWNYVTILDTAARYYQCYCRDQKNYYSTIQHAMSQQVMHEKGVTPLLLPNVDMK